jgi:hypothetical protein
MAILLADSISRRLLMHMIRSDRSGAETLDDYHGSWRAAKAFAARVERAAAKDLFHAGS